MIARAPGKVVLSGAYAVLEGAPALVAAVDRYVVADATREAPTATEEVAAALVHRASGRAPWFDARALRNESEARKLGLGSSAAILVASLAALELSTHELIDDRALAARVFGPALRAHRQAQGGGSGVDVAASSFGGILCFRRASNGDALPSIEEKVLPAHLYVSVWSSMKSASTAEMLGRVSTLRETRADDYRSVMQRLFAAAECACLAPDASSFIEACREQQEGLAELGELAHAPIVTPEVHTFDRAMKSRGAVVLPSGAGGGDVVLLVSHQPSDLETEGVGRQSGLVPLSLSLGARGVHGDRTSARRAPSNEIAP